MGIAFPAIDPVAVRVGPLSVHWYGLMYLIGFLAAWQLGRIRATGGWSRRDVSDLVFYGALGAVLGGRLGYVLFYDLGAVAAEPLRALRIWEGGMSFHGGLIGAVAALALFARQGGRRFFEVTDFAAPLVPIGLGAGRIGNFINGELWGRTSDVPWAMIFPDPGSGGLPRHPSQLYEAFLEGLVLFVVLWIFSRRPRPVMAISGLFLAGYGSLRFLVEFTRMPDLHIGFVAGDWMTMGQLLSVPMVIAGAALLVMAYRASRAGSEAR